MSKPEGDELPKPDLILGIDPGLSGALALFNPFEKKLVAATDMPLSPKTMSDGREKKEIDLYALAEFIGDYAPRIIFACIEEVGANAMHGRTQGVVSMFRFGFAAGAAQSAVAAHGIPIRLVIPAVWKPQMSLNKDKNHSRNLASKLFPDASHLFLRVKDDGRAEAALLAVFGARFLKPAA